MEIETAIFRLLLTFFLAVLFGFESQRSHKPVGFGTFTFVAIGSCVWRVSEKNQLENEKRRQ